MPARRLARPEVLEPPRPQGTLRGDPGDVGEQVQRQADGQRAQVVRLGRVFVVRQAPQVDVLRPVPVDDAAALGLDLPGHDRGHDDLVAPLHHVADFPGQGHVVGGERACVEVLDPQVPVPVLR